MSNSNDYEDTYRPPWSAIPKEWDIVHLSHTNNPGDSQKELSVIMKYKNEV